MGSLCVNEPKPNVDHQITLKTLFPPNFMDEIYKKLESRKGGQYPDLQSNTRYYGFKIIPIQKL